MKQFSMVTLLALIIGNIGALDTESYQLIDHLIGLVRPGGPEVLDDGVLFTAPSAYRSVGIAFAHEGFAKIYRFEKLMTVRDDPEAADAKKGDADLYRDSGILFYAYPAPQDMRELEYRLIIDGLWTVDPLNPLRRIDERSGIYRSVVVLPETAPSPASLDNPPGTLNLSYQAPSGETVTVAGDFNGWDPFMYELRETAPGLYSLVLPLPPGTYRYLLYYRGQTFPDPNNPNKVYNRSGDVVSEALIR
jgi:hypothetical protein